MKYAKKITATFLAFLLFMGHFAFPAQAQENIQVVVTFEGYNLGQGYYIEPQVVTVPKGSNAAEATVKLLSDNGYEYRHTGQVASSFYLSGVKGFDKGFVHFPDYLIAQGMDNNNHKGNKDEWLTEFDYSDMSGWMITVDHVMLPVGASQYTLTDGEVVRWQFTVQGYGADLGLGSGWDDPYYTHNDKTKLIDALARQSIAPEVKQRLLAVAIDPVATEADIAKALAEIGGAGETAPNIKETMAVKEAMEKSTAFLKEKVTDPAGGSVGGEWAVLALSRSGQLSADMKAKYVASIEEMVEKNGEILHSAKYTENSRTIIGLTAAGLDASKFAGADLTRALSNTQQTFWQGANGAIYGLIAMDTKPYTFQAFEGVVPTRQTYIDEILRVELAGGGWALFGKNPDPDMTGMAIQALAPYYEKQAAVKAAVDRGLTVLSQMQDESGGFSSWGTVASESTAQVMGALLALGIDPAKDARFIKGDGNWLLSNLLRFSTETNGKLGFAHTIGGAVDLMATEQASYTLVAYDRFLAGKTSLYDMSDISLGEGGESTPAPEKKTGVSLEVPSAITNKVGESFQVKIKISTDLGLAKAVSGILDLHESVQVVSVDMHSSLQDGVDYKLEDGKLRFVYGDFTKDEAIAFPQDEAYLWMSVHMKLKEKVNGVSLPISLSRFMVHESAAITRLYEDGNSIASIPVQEDVNGLVITSTELYTGDGTDFIPDDKKAVRVVIGGLSAYEGSLGFTAQGQFSNLYVEKNVTDIADKRTYFMVVDKQLTKEVLEKADNYSLFSGEKEMKFAFGDMDKSGEIDSQDALSLVAIWLRKQVPDAIDAPFILTGNTNADGAINVSDAVAVVEYFIGKSEFLVNTR